MSNGLDASTSLEEDLLQCSVCRSTLNDPVLLKCLHSSCMSCASDATSDVSCRACGVTTDTSKREANLLVSALGHRSVLMNNIFSCTSCCLVQAQQDVASVTWCYTCQQSLCIDCEKCHNITFHFSAHKLIKLDEHTVLSELYRLPTRLCSEHGEEQKLVCFTCQDGRCFKCAHDCYRSSHDVQLLDSPAAADRLNDRIADTARVLSDLNSTSTSLQAHLSLPEKVAIAMEESRAALRNAKKTAIDSISKAYEQTENSLLECCDILLSKAHLLRHSAEGLQQRLDWTNTYCQVALNTKDVAALLPQLNTLGSCLRSLLDELRQLKIPADPLKMVSLNVCLPCDLNLITSDWFGQPTLANEDFDSPATAIPDDMKAGYYIRRVSTLTELEELLKKQKEQEEVLTRERQALLQLESKLKCTEQQLASGFSCERCGYDGGGDDEGGHDEDGNHEDEYYEDENDGARDDEDVYDGPEHDGDGYDGHEYDGDGYDGDDYDGGGYDGGDY